MYHTDGIRERIAQLNGPRQNIVLIERRTGDPTS
jgi:hypothetical protein